MDVFLGLSLWVMGVMLVMLVHKFMLVVLMMLEVLVMVTFMVMFMMMGDMGIEVYVIYYLIFSVCESVLGLMILVLVIRFHGNEYYHLMNLYKF